MVKCKVCGRRMDDPEYHVQRYHPEFIGTRKTTSVRKRRVGSRRVIVVDGNNVAYFGGSPSIRNLKIARSGLIKQGYDPIIVVSSALLHRIDSRGELVRMVNMGWVTVADDSESDDVEAIEGAMRNRCELVSNDRFMEYRSLYGNRYDFTKLRRFRIVDGRFVLD